MKAAVTHTFGETRVEEVPRPRPGPGEAVIEVEACGVCSGEGVPWYVNRKVPIVLGHEVVGRISEVGEGVDPARVGERVFAHHHVPCGECHPCRRGHPSSCRLFRETALDPGGYAEYLRVPRENFQRDTPTIPPGIALEEAVFLEPVACSVRAFRRLRLRKGESLALVGLGSMGLLNLRLARRLGASPIIGSDFFPERREIAARTGADLVIDPAVQDLRKEVEAITDGHGADRVIVGPGTAEALQAALAVAGPGGTVLQYTPTPRDDPLQIDTYRFYFDELTLIASYSAGPQDTREALDIISEGEVHLADLVTGRFGLDGVDEAMKLIGKGGPHLKSVIYPRGNVPPGGR